MCLGIPMQIVEIDGDVGYVESGGVKRKVGLMLLDDVRVGDWVIVHAGFAIEKIKPEEALETLRLIAEGVKTLTSEAGTKSPDRGERS